MCKLDLTEARAVRAGPGLLSRRRTRGPPSRWDLFNLMPAVETPDDQAPVALTVQLVKPSDDGKDGKHRHRSDRHFAVFQAEEYNPY